MLRMACEEATKSDRLPGVLERVLAIGNVLNEGILKAFAHSFKASVHISPSTLHLTGAPSSGIFNASNPT